MDNAQYNKNKSNNRESMSVYLVVAHRKFRTN